MNDLEKLMNAAISTQWTLSPALLVMFACGWTAVTNKVRGK